MPPKVNRHTNDEQLKALARLVASFSRKGVAYWMFGGWAVDFYAGTITRQHNDLDLAVWIQDAEVISAILKNDGWKFVAEEEGYTVYANQACRLELAFLERDKDGSVYTPLDKGRAEWPDNAFGEDIRELRGINARMISLGALKKEKSQDLTDPAAAQKDGGDLEVLKTLEQEEADGR